MAVVFQNQNHNNFIHASPATVSEGSSYSSVVKNKQKRRQHGSHLFDAKSELKDRKLKQAAKLRFELQELHERRKLRDAHEAQTRKHVWKSINRTQMYATDAQSDLKAYKCHQASNQRAELRSLIESRERRDHIIQHVNKLRAREMRNLESTSRDFKEKHLMKKQSESQSNMNASIQMCTPKRNISTPTQPFQLPATFGGGPIFPTKFSPLRSPKIHGDDDNDSYRSRRQRSLEEPFSPSSPGEVEFVDVWNMNPRCIIRQPTPNRNSGDFKYSCNSSWWENGVLQLDSVAHNALPRREISKSKLAELGLGKSPDEWGVKQNLSAPKYSFLSKKRECEQRARIKDRARKLQEGEEMKLLSRNCSLITTEEAPDSSTMNPGPIQMPSAFLDGGESMSSLLRDDDTRAGEESRHSHQSFHSFDDFAADLEASVGSQSKAENWSMYDDETLTLSRVAVSTRLPVADLKKDKCVSFDSRYGSFDSVDLTVGAQSTGDPEGSRYETNKISPVKIKDIMNIPRQRLNDHWRRHEAAKQYVHHAVPSGRQNPNLRSCESIITFAFVNCKEAWNNNSRRADSPRDYFERMQTGGPGQCLQKNASRVLQTEQRSGTVHDLNIVGHMKRGRDYRTEDTISYVGAANDKLKIRSKERNFFVEYDPMDNLDALKHRIGRVLLISPNQQLLVFHGKLLRDNIRLSTQSIIGGDCLDLLVHQASDITPIAKPPPIQQFPRASAFGLPPSLPRATTPELKAAGC